MEWEILNKERPRSSLVARLQLVLTLVAVVGLAIELFTNWASIHRWGRYAILGFIAILALVALVRGIIPVTRLIKAWIDSRRMIRHQRKSLRQFAELVQEARALFDPQLTCSLRNYVESMRNALAQNQSLHSQFKRLAERLQVLEDWHWSLLTFTNPDIIGNAPFTDIVRHIVRLYRDTADVVRELASIKLPEDGSVRAYDDQRRMMKGKYNQHMGRVEQLLERIAKVSPELQTAPFHRF